MAYTVNDKFSYKGKVAVIVHIYYKDIWENSIKDRIKNVLNGNCDYDLYVSITKRDAKEIEEITKSVKDVNPDAVVIEVENVGEDVNGFMHCVDEIKKREKEYDYILKIHTKRSEEWRTSLINGVLPTNCRTLNTCLENKEPMICASRWIYTMRDAENKIDDILNKIGCKRHPLRFAAGTIFWVRFDIIKKYIMDGNLPVDYFDEAYKVANLKQHAMERIFGMMVTDMNESIKGI